MRVFGKMLEYRSELIHVVCNYNVQISSGRWSFGYWPSTIYELDNIDTDIFDYVPSQDQTRILIKELGWYEFSYTILSKTSWNYSNALEAVIEIGNGNTSNEIERTRTIQGTSRKGATNSVSTTVKIDVPNTWVSLKYRSTETYNTLFIRPGGINLKIGRVRPLGAND